MVCSGDREASVRSLARELGPDIAEYAEQSPGDKAALVRQAGTLFVGDGVNDALALAEASVGVAMGGGTDLAREAGDAVLVRPDLNALPALVRLARATASAMRRNLTWAVAYNVAMLPLAAGLLEPWGLRLGPMLASAAMALSSVSVVLSSVALRWARVS
jgi:Cu+-exporting ATPase